MFRVCLQDFSHLISLNLHLMASITQFFSNKWIQEAVIVLAVKLNLYIQHAHHLNFVCNLADSFNYSLIIQSWIVCFFCLVFLCVHNFVIFFCAQQIRIFLLKFHTAISLHFFGLFVFITFAKLLLYLLIQKSFLKNVHYHFS